MRKTLKPSTPSRRAFALACLAATLLAAGCATQLQTYSSPQHRTLHLKPQDLAEGGLAFLTPSTVTGQEEDKQSLAYVFADALKAKRPEIRFDALPQTIGAVNRAGVTGRISRPGANDRPWNHDYHQCNAHRRRRDYRVYYHQGFP